VYTSSAYDNNDAGDADNLNSNEADPNGFKQGVSQTVVNQVVSLLAEEKDEELKTLLKENYSLDDESVCIRFHLHPLPHALILPFHRLIKMCSTSCINTATMSQAFRFCS
jgi:hypothetical protein